MGTKTARVFLGIGFAVGLVWLTLLITGIRADTKDHLAASTTGARPPTPSMSPSVEELQLREEIRVLRERIDAQNRLLDVLLLVAAGVAGLAVLSQFLSPVERRAKEAQGLGREAHEWAGERHQWARESHQIATEGERSRQSRDDSLFRSSQETVQLVNATLALARDATQRANESLRLETEQDLERLEKGAKKIILDSSSDDDRDLVTDQHLRERFRANARQVGELKGQLRILRTDMTPCAQFLYGMNAHLEGDFEEALARWSDVTVDPQADADLKSRAWYWIGYEHNNIGKFDEGAKAFGHAMDGATGSRLFELRRISLESRFFDRQDTGTIQAGLSELLNEMVDSTRTDHSRRPTAVLTTLGNVLFERGRELAATGQSAREVFEEAHRRFAEASFDEDRTAAKWALFGLAQATAILEGGDAASLVFSEVTPALIDEHRNRDELRTKVLAISSQFIAALHVLPQKAERIRALDTETTYLASSIRHPLTIYSQVQKRNVTKAGFFADMDQLWSQYQGAGATPHTS